MTLPTQAAAVFLPLAPAFTAPTFDRFVLLATAAILTSYQDNNSNSLTYGYDNAGQLLSASGTLNSASYSYDANGNRNMTGYSTGAGNELTSDGTYSDFLAHRSTTPNGSLPALAAEPTHCG